jgi:hypothetical protein
VEQGMSDMDLLVVIVLVVLLCGGLGYWRWR